MVEILFSESEAASMKAAKNKIVKGSQTDWSYSGVFPDKYRRLVVCKED